jgi:hypothetical protein
LVREREREREQYTNLQLKCSSPTHESRPVGYRKKAKEKRKWTDCRQKLLT